MIPRARTQARSVREDRLHGIPRSSETMLPLDDPGTLRHPRPAPTPSPRRPETLATARQSRRIMPLAAGAPPFPDITPIIAASRHQEWGFPVRREQKIP